MKEIFVFKLNLLLKMCYDTKYFESIINFLLKLIFQKQVLADFDLTLFITSTITKTFEM